MSSPVPVSPDDDTDAQAKIWRDTQLGAKELLERWNVRLYLACYEQSDFLRTANTPIVGAGKLVELLSVVSLLRSADSMQSQKIYNLRGTVPAIPFRKGGAQRFLWVQPTRLKGRSGWGGRPDLLVTTALNGTVASNDFVIECKHIANLRSGAIRAELGKGFDPGIRKYHIWSFYEPPHEMVDGAAALGIVLSGVGFDTAAHTHDIAPGRLLDLFTERLDQADQENAFVKAMQQSVLEIGTRSTTQYTIK